MHPTLALGSRRSLLWTGAGAAALVAWLALRPAPSPRVSRVQVFVPFPVVTVPASPAEPQPAPPPAVARRVLGARGAASTIAAWTEDTILVSHSDGAIFDPPLEVPAPVAGVDIDGEGTVFAACGDRLLVLHRYGDMAWRPLPFGSWPDWPLEVSEVFADEGWVGVVADASVALTRDEGRTWQLFAIAGEADYAQHAAVDGSTLITTGARYGFEGADSAIERRRLGGGGARATGAEYREVVGIGHDGVVYSRCAGAVCGNEEYEAENPYDQVVRGDDATYAVRRDELVVIRGGRARIIARDVPDGFVLTGATGGGDPLGIDPARGALRWSSADGWRPLL